MPDWIADRARIVTDDRSQHGGVRLALECPLPCEHLVKNRGKGKHVARWIDWLALRPSQRLHAKTNLICDRPD
jgi:hypothetical protein